MAKSEDKKSSVEVLEGEASVLENLQARVDGLSATLRRLCKRAELHWGQDVDGDGKVGSVRVLLVVGLAVLSFVASAMAANEVVWKVGDSAYVDAEGDATFNSVAADVTGAVTATTVDASGDSTFDEDVTLGNATNDVVTGYIVETAGVTNGIAAFQLFSSNGVVRVWGN